MNTPKLIACSVAALVASPLIAVAIAAFVCTMTVRWAIVEAIASWHFWRMRHP